MPDTATAPPPAPAAPTVVAPAPAAPSPGSSFRDKVMGADSPAPKVEAPKPVEKAPVVAPEAKPAAETPVVESSPKPDTDIMGKLRRGEITDEPVKKNNPGLAPTNPDDPGFKTWKEGTDAWRRDREENAALKKQIEEITGKVPKDYEEVVKTRNELQQQLAARDLTQTPEFQREVQQPLTNLFTNIKKVADAVKVNWGDVVRAVDEPDELARDAALNAIFTNAETDVSAATIARVVIQAGEIAALREHGDNLLKNAPDVMGALKAEQEKTTEAKKAKAKEEHSRATNVALQWLENEAGLLTTKEMKESAREAAGQDWDTMKPVPRAYALAAAGILDMVWKESQTKDETISTKDKEIASLKIQLQKLSASSPSSEAASVVAGAVKNDGSAFRNKMLGV